MNRTINAYGKRRGKISVEKLHEKNKSENLGVNGRLAFRGILNKQDGCVWTEFIWFYARKQWSFVSITMNRQVLSETGREFQLPE
jgi:hypothetical protein